MSPSEASKLLALCGAFDNRKPDTSGMAAAAWADALGGLSFEDCANAIRKHYRDTDRYIMPAHVRQQVEKIREYRAALSRVTDGPLSLPSADERGVPMPPEIREQLSRFLKGREIPDDEQAVS